MRSIIAVVLLAVVTPGIANAGPVTGLPPVHTALMIPYKVTVTPKDSALGDFFVTTNNIGVVFTVKNTGTNTDTYTLTCTAFMASCVSQSYYVATLTAGQSIQVQVTFNTTGTAGSGAYVALEAQSVNADGYGQYHFTNWARINYVVLVTPVTGSAPSVNSFSGPFQAVFTIKNVGLLRDSFNLTCQSSANLSCTSQTRTTTPGLNSFQTSVDTITYASGASGVAFIQQTASDSNTSTASGKYNLTVLVGPSTGVAVTPDAQAVGVRASVSASRPFKVRNTGTASNTFNISVPTCTAPASGCSASPTSLTLASGATGITTVSYTSGTSGTGKISVLATLSTDPNVKDSGWVNVSIGTMQAPTADVVSVNPGSMLERGVCVAVALTRAAASECGDLRLAHTLPAVRTMNKVRVPTLLYSSATAHPYPLVAVNVTLPSGAANPDTVFAKLSINNAGRDSGKWSGAGFSPGRASRIVLGYDAIADSTGVYSYSVTVTNIYNAGSSLGSSPASGQVDVVRRDTSSFGAGWWLAGLEALKNPTPTAGSILWMAGDGSAHPYASAGTNRWAAAAMDHPDTLKWNGTSYVRYLPGGLQVQFDGNGRHVRTINRLSDTTRFHYNASGQLDTLYVPVPSGATAVKYSFAYTSNKLTSVTAPPLGATARITTLTDSGSLVTKIQDPDTTTVRFSYDATFANRVTARTNRRGYKTSFWFDAGKKVAKDSLDPGANQPVIVTQLRALESQGLHTATPGDVVDTALAYTLLDGPRTDVGDSTQLWLDRYGEPRRVVNALGGQTLLSRTDTRWPISVTRVQQPNGRVMRDTFDIRGHDSTVTDSGTVVNGQVAITRFVWNQTWDAVERIVPPELDSTVIHYDSTNGNRMWQQDSRGTVSRVTFGYSSTTRLLTSVRLPGATQADSFHYDAVRGNLDLSKTPIGFQATHLTDALGRDTLIVMPVDSAQTIRDTQRIYYNLADRVVQSRTQGPAMPYTFTAPGLVPDTTTVNAETLFVVNTYDAEGGLTGVTSYSRPDRACYKGPEGCTYNGDLFDSRTYNGAGLLLTLRLGSGPTSFTYDAAGNPVRQRYLGGNEVTEVYDALNRPVQRIVPALDYSYLIWPGIYPIDSSRHFPLYPNNGTGYRVTADTSTFVYDAVGNLLEADNKDARVSRTYAPNGQMLSDSLRIRALTGPVYDAFSGVTFGYDRDGRIVWGTLPGSLATPSQDTLHYQYAGPSGALSQVRDGWGRTYNYMYDAAARMDSLIEYPTGAPPIGVSEIRTYDADSRLATRTRRAGSGSVLTSETLGYDARGKIIVAYNQDAAQGHNNEQTRLAYDALGAVVASEDRDLNGTLYQAEEFRNNAFGNVWYSRRTTLSDGPEQSRRPTMNSLRAVVAIRTDTIPTGTCLNAQVHQDTTYQSFDGNNNVARQAEYVTACYGVFPLIKDMAAVSYFSADNRLVALQRYVNNSNTTNSGTWEEYRYDALGRRVMVRARRDSTGLCWTTQPDVCVSFVHRTAWDGDQVLMEQRNTGTDGGGGAPHYGLVGYIHGTGIDAPLAIVDTRFSTPARIPHPNWRGLGESSTWPDGSPADCSLMAGPCTTIAWPAGDGIYFRQAAPPTSVDTWVGSLVANGQDGTGQLYRRNRYFDPLTGRFTQQDPLGLGGGLNLYDLGGGDPVNFGDPFGLCPTPTGKDDLEGRERADQDKDENTPEDGNPDTDQQSSTVCFGSSGTQAFETHTISVSWEPQGDPHGDPKSYSWTWLAPDKNGIVWTQTIDFKSNKFITTGSQDNRVVKLHVRSPTYEERLDATRRVQAIKRQCDAQKKHVDSLPRGTKSQS